MCICVIKGGMKNLGKKTKFRDSIIKEEKIAKKNRDNLAGQDEQYTLTSYEFGTQLKTFIINYLINILKYFNF